jgi:hypothetical protein
MSQGFPWFSSFLEQVHSRCWNSTLHSISLYFVITVTRNAVLKVVNLYLPLCTPLRCMGIVRIATLVLTSAIDGSHWPTSRSGHFTPGEGPLFLSEQEAGWAPNLFWMLNAPAGNRTTISLHVSVNISLNAVVYKLNIFPLCSQSTQHFVTLSTVFTSRRLAPFKWPQYVTATACPKVIFSYLSCGTQGNLIDSIQPLGKESDP